MKSNRQELIQKDLETNRKWKLRKRDNPKSPLKFRVWVTAIFPCHGFASAQSRESQDYIQVLQLQETVLLHHLLSGSLTEEPVWWTSLPRHTFTIAFLPSPYSIILPYGSRLSAPYQGHQKKSLPWDPPLLWLIWIMYVGEATETEFSWMN